MKTSELTIDPKTDSTRHPMVTEYGGYVGRGRLVTREEARPLFAKMKQRLAKRFQRIA